MTKQEFATLVVAMQAMYGKDFIGTEQALDVWYALLHDLDYQILSKVLQQYIQAYRCGTAGDLYRAGKSNDF